MFQRFMQIVCCTFALLAAAPSFAIDNFLGSDPVDRGTSMSTSNTPVVVYVTYQGTPQTRFDRTYYVTHHLPLVMKAWQQYGLLSATAFFPAAGQVGTIAICECIFRDEAAVKAAFSSREVPEVMADVPRFTDVASSRVRAVEL